MLESFFKDLPVRSPKETHLSDVTWAIARNCDEFLVAFLQFFDFKFDSNAPLDIYREYVLPDGNRPDFAIENGPHLFIVENKIYDKNYYIEQYGRSSYPQGKKIEGIGIIVNHKVDDITLEISKRDRVKIRTWEKFVSFMERGFKEERFEAESEKYIRTYLQYVKEACSVMELKEVRFGSLLSLFYFNRLVRKTLGTFHREGFECKLYTANARAFGENWSGQYFSLKKKDERVELYPFLGVYYGEEPPTIYFAFERDWCKDIYLKYKGKQSENDLYYIEAADWEVSFCLSEDRFEEFGKGSLADQEAMLAYFLCKTIDEISQHL